MDEDKPSADASAKSGTESAEKSGGILAWPFSKFLIAGAFGAELVAISLFVGPSPANATFVIPFLGPVVILCALALWKGRPWMFLGAGISLAIFPMLVLAFSIDSFVVPQLGIVFAAGMFLLIALVVGLPTGIWVFAHRKSSTPPMTAREGLKTRYGVFNILAVGILLGAALAGEAAYINATSGGATNGGSDLQAEAWVNVTTENFLFVPANLTIPVGKIVEITVTNKDSALHTFTYKVDAGTASEKTYSHNLLPSSTTKFSMLISAAGTVHFWCIPHEAMGMAGDFHVS
jgi:plastocyanin